jgi:hypothetical protein
VEEPLGRTWEQCAGQRESEAPLSGLDGVVTFGDDFPDPIRYDAARGVLRYRGLMSHGSFRYLGGLSRDYRYQRALEQLFVATATPLAAGPSWTTWLGAAAAVVVLLAAAWFGISRLLPRDGNRPLVPQETMTAGGAPGGNGRRDVSPPPRKQVDESSAAAQDRER